MDTESRVAAVSGRTVPAGRAVRELYRLRSDARAASHADGGVVLQQPRYEAEIPNPTVGCRAMLLRLAEKWTAETEICRMIGTVEGERGIMRGQLLLRRLLLQSWLQRRLQAADRPLLDVVPLGLGTDSVPSRVKVAQDTRCRLSRFVTVSADGDAALLAQTPLSAVAVALRDTRLAGTLVPAAAAGCTGADLARLAGLDLRAAFAVLEELLTARILVPQAEHEAERSQPPGAVWAPHELAMHHRARTGLHALPIGGTRRFQGSFPAEPLVRDGRPGAATARTVDLPEPDLAAISGTDPSLTEVIARRRSIRSHDSARPITADQLAEFLYRVQHTALAQAAGDVPGQAGDGLELAAAPPPTGGQLGDLEIYPLVSNCAGIAGGLYWYDSVAHRLTLLAPPHPSGHRMLTHARDAAVMTQPPQVLLVITARVQRLLWKYEGMGYALALKNSGVLTGLMYLVATAMGLAPCAIGSGDSASFALLSGLDPLVEPSIADFALGTIGTTGQTTGQTTGDVS